MVITQKDKYISNNAKIIEGFPKGDDVDIEALSRIPNYTAFPNPYINEFIIKNGKPYNENEDAYHREPFASDVSEGKTDPLYLAHVYHTKVPYKAILKYILHYTDPGDVVFDGFCGTGMTGVAARIAGELENNTITGNLNSDGRKTLGKRFSVLSDLSPAATFIANDYNNLSDIEGFKTKLDEAIASCEKEFGWMYETYHVDTQGNPIQNILGEDVIGQINFVVWSDVFICPNCSKEFSFWDVAIDTQHGTVRDEFNCPHCNSILKKSGCKHSFESFFDDNVNEIVNISRQAPVYISYSVSGKRYNKKPDSHDLEILQRIRDYKIKTFVPTGRTPEGIESRRNDNAGILYAHQFYTKRNLIAFSALWDKLRNTPECLFALTASNINISKLYRYRANGKGGNLSGTLYVPSTPQENNVFRVVERKKNDIIAAFSQLTDISPSSIISTGSSTDLRNIPDNCIDYIFTDPPFGANINYSELSFLWESWLKVLTNNRCEAVINTVQHKGLLEYQNLMTKCFQEFNRILKPGRWMTVEFHNSQNSVWNAIQESLQRSNFVIADVRILDKKQSSFKQVNSTVAVKQDLVISAYKPKEKFYKNFILKAGSEEAMWEFVRQHLENLPIAPDGNHDGNIDLVAERQNFLLYDRMVAWHVTHGVSVPLNANEFYQGLNDHFLERDGMYFLPGQVNEYDQKRSVMELENVQMAFAIQDEKGAIQWLNFQLNTPQTYQELQPKYLQELHQLRSEQMPELMDLLKENFLQDNEGKWYVPDITKAGDVAKLREKSLLKDFEGYLQTKGKIKTFRSEAIRAGFAKLWKEKDYKNIVAVAERLPEQTIQEDPNLLMYYDISLSRL